QDTIGAVERVASSTNSRQHVVATSMRFRSVAGNGLGCPQVAQGHCHYVGVGYPQVRQPCCVGEAVEAFKSRLRYHRIIIRQLAGHHVGNQRGLGRWKCGSNTERDAGGMRAWHTDDAHVVAHEIDAGVDQQLLESEFDHGGGPDGAASDRANVARRRGDVSAQDQDPEHALRKRHKELAATPFRKRGERDMRWRGNEIDLIVTQGLVSLVVRENQFMHNVEAFALEEIERDRRDCREIGVGDEVGDGDAGGAQAAVSCCGCYFGTNLGAYTSAAATGVASLKAPLTTSRVASMRAGSISPSGLPGTFASS